MNHTKSFLRELEALGELQGVDHLPRIKAELVKDFQYNIDLKGVQLEGFIIEVVDTTETPMLIIAFPTEDEHIFVQSYLKVQDVWLKHNECIRVFAQPDSAEINIFKSTPSPLEYYVGVGDRTSSQIYHDLMYSTVCAVVMRFLSTFSPDQVKDVDGYAYFVIPHLH